MKSRMELLGLGCLNYGMTIFLSILLIALTLHPWILYGFRGPGGDGVGLLEAAVAKYGFMKLYWSNLLLTGGVSLFIAPLLFVMPNPWFFWIGSSVLALATLWGTWYIWQIYSHLFSFRSSAWIGSFIVAAHPFLHQMQYWWMSDTAYVVLLFIGLYQVSVYLVKGRLSNLLLASISLALSLLVRPQAMLAYFVCTAVTLLAGLSDLFAVRSLSLSRRVCDLILFCGLGFALTLPVRYLNHIQHNTWQLTKYFSKNLTFYLQHEGYSRFNGPASERLWQMARIIRFAPEWRPIRDNLDYLDHLELPSRGDFRPLSTLPPAQRLGDWKKAISDNSEFSWLYRSAYRNAIGITTDEQHSNMDLNGPNVIYFVFDDNWKKADDFGVQVWSEAVHKHPVRYLKWGLFWSKGYFTWLSENPNEWHAHFAAGYMQNKLAEREVSSIRVHDKVVLANHRGGLAFIVPGLVDKYSAFRLFYARSMTYVRKITFLMLPLLIFVIYKKGPPQLFGFTVLAVFSHLLSCLLLAMILGFHHRYSAPFELFTIFYVVCWYDIGCRWLDDLKRNSPKHFRDVLNVPSEEVSVRV